MATCGFSSDDEDNVECLMKWPLEYVNETKEYMCGWCGQVQFVVDHNAEGLKTHFKNCKNTKENALLMVFKELRKMNQKFQELNDGVQTKIDKLKTEVTEEIKYEILNVKTEFENEFEIKETEFGKVILDLKSRMKNDSEAKRGMTKKEDKMRAKAMTEVRAEILNIKTEIGKDMEENKTEINKKISDLKSEFKKEWEKKNAETTDAVLPTLFKKIKVFEEEMKKEMSELNGRVSGVTETISTLVHSVLEAKGSSSAEIALLDERSKKEAEALWAHLTASERGSQTIKTDLEKEVVRLKTRTETFSKQLDIHDLRLRVIDEQLKDELSKKKSFHPEPSSLLDQFAIPMTCFNLISHKYLFRPSFKWTIGEIDTIMWQQTFKLSSEKFQWNGYPVQARANFQLKEDGCVYLSLSLRDVLRDDRKLKDFQPIPNVFYLLKDKFGTNSSDFCRKTNYLTGSTFGYSLEFGLCFRHKSWINQTPYKVNNSIQIEIYVEPSPMAQLVHSYDGTLDWKIENYARRLQLEMYGLVDYQESPYFYTSASGYRIEVGLSLTGGGRGRLTAYVSFVSGKCDAEQPKSFPHCTTVTLVNHRNPKRSIKRTLAADTKIQRYYDLEICNVEEVADLIENDTLYCKVVIKSH